MAERPHTTKIRAKRITLDYFKGPHPFRRWKLLLSIALPLVAVGWLAAYAVLGDPRIYNSGPVSTAHAMFGARCADCHATRTADGAVARPGFFLTVSEQTCSVCHEGPVHHSSQGFTPPCATCHFEHKGRTRLVDLGDRQCTQCHARLETKEGRPPTVEPTIAGFASGHPEFAVSVVDGGRTTRVRLNDKAARDTAQVMLNHAKHLKVGLKGLDDVKAQTGKFGLVERDGRVALGCTYCHRLDAHRVSIEPISFARHCMVCHPLDVDGRLPGAVAPHDRPALVHAYLRTTLIEAFEECQALPKNGATNASAKPAKQCNDLGLTPARAMGRQSSETREDPAPDAPRGRRLGGPAPAEEPVAERPRGLRSRDGEAEAAAPGTAPPSPSALDWAATQLPGTEKVMFRQKCGFCHTLSQPASGLPEVAPTAIPTRWLPHSVFDHGVHRSVGCTECHGKATKSTATTDVLLPSVSVCRECHRAAGGARAACVTCHLYHDKTKERDPDGPLTVRRLVHGGAGPAGASPSR